MQSYRPFIGDISENPDGNIFIFYQRNINLFLILDRNKLKNVGLLNNQTESNKPATTTRKKLNPNKEFIPSNYQADSPSKKLGLKINKYESSSEPGSAISLNGGLKKTKNNDEEETKEKFKDSFQASDIKTVQKNLSSDNLFDHFINNKEYPSIQPYQNQQQQYISMSYQPQKQVYGYCHNQSTNSKSLRNSTY